jgi:hypothetical protein
MGHISLKNGGDKILAPSICSKAGGGNEKNSVLIYGHP